MIGVFRSYGGDFPIGDVADIINVEAKPGRAEHYVIKRLSGRESVSLLAWEHQDLMHRPVQLLTAEPGTLLIRLYVGGEDEEPVVDRSPVLAWALCFDGQVRPVLPSGVHSASERRLYNDYLQIGGKIFEFGFEADPEALSTIAEAIQRVKAVLKRASVPDVTSGEGEAQ